MRVFLLLLLLVGCAKKLPPAGAAYGEELSFSADSPVGDEKSAPSRSSRPSRPSAPGAPGSPALEAAPAGPDAAPAAERMVHYQGLVALRVGKTRDAVEAVVALATAAGGSLERQHGDTVVLRVPVARFQEVFDAVLRVGDVTRKAITAEDVTEAFTAVELRLKTAQARRDRLVQLLALSKDENEKLALVREIQEATEEIDRLDAQSRTLRSLAEYSRITVQITQRPVLTWRGSAPESAAFAWIRGLSPFTAEIQGRKLPLDEPAGFVALDVKRRFVAESAEGARIWTARMRNDPAGSTAFWTEALQRRLSPEFASAEEVRWGEWSGLRLVDRSDTPYVWLVLVRADGKHLDLTQVYYPSKAAEDRHSSAVEAVLGAGGAS